MVTLGLPLVAAIAIGGIPAAAQLDWHMRVSQANAWLEATAGGTASLMAAWALIAIMERHAQRATRPTNRSIDGGTRGQPLAVKNALGHLEKWEQAYQDPRSLPEERMALMAQLNAALVHEAFELPLVTALLLWCGLALLTCPTPIARTPAFVPNATLALAGGCVALFAVLVTRSLSWLGGKLLIRAAEEQMHQRLKPLAEPCQQRPNGTHRT